ncbi:MAG: endonuclease/exonuclease/phosphatase family protein [Holophaga sp.]|nr:endonuclease/exonuclease/phosphatase family protein [Holophaga sp.]
MEALVLSSATSRDNPAAPFAAPHLPARLHIYTQNVFGLPFTRRARRFQALCQRIRELAPDVVFLQEALFAGDEKHFRIEGYHAACVPNGLFNRGGLLILSRVPLTRVRFHPFRAQGAWHNLQLSDRLLGKGWLEAEAADWGITLVNTHLVSTYQESRRFVHDLEQRAQLEQVLRVVARLGPSVLAGDFNFTEGTPFHGIAEATVEDVARGLHPLGLAHLQPKLDHIFVRDLGWRAAQARWVVPGTLAGTRGAVCLSDHAGVSVELNLGWGELPYPAAG